MNDQDTKICKCDCGEKNQDCNYKCSCVYERPRKYLKSNRTTLKCGSLGSIAIPAGTVFGAALTLATVNVDTKNYRKPCIIFEFASNILTTAAIITINFQLFKQCRGQFTPIAVGPIWTFSRLVAVTEGDTFSFYVCDCDICDDGCCVYSVVATVSGLAEEIAVTIGDTVINNASLSALIVDNG